MAKKDSAGTGSAGDASNKSQAIRDIYTADPKADTKTVKARLEEQGIEASPALIYYIRGKLGKARRRAKRAEATESIHRTTGRDPIDVVLRVKNLANDVGGIRHLKKLVDALAE